MGLFSEQCIRPEAGFGSSHFLSESVNSLRSPQNLSMKVVVRD